MCVGDDTHGLYSFVHSRRETNRYSFRVGFLRFVYHMRWAFSFLCWIKYLGCYPWHMLDELLDLCQAVCRFMPDICWTCVLIFVFCLYHVFDSACWYSLDENTNKKPDPSKNHPTYPQKIKNMRTKKHSIFSQNYLQKFLQYIIIINLFSVIRTITQYIFRHE